MLEKITFTNHDGETITSADSGIYAMYNDLHDYLWNYTQSSADKIVQFSRGIVKKTLPLVILCNSETEGIEIRNQLMTIADKDVLAKEPGRISINGYYLEAYIIGSTKSNYLYNKRFMEVDLTILSDNPVWTKEEDVTYLPSEERALIDTREPIDAIISGAIYEGEPLDEPYMRDEYPSDYIRPSTYTVVYAERDYPFDYYFPSDQQTITNPFYRACNFEMTIYGYAVNPSIIIGEHVYTVEVTVYEGERIIINSRDKTVIKIDSLGNETNIYNARGKEYSVFQAIPTGTTNVSWSGEWGFEITLYDERSEPEWSL